MLVVFDLDGTVVDSTRALLEAHREAWAGAGRALTDDAHPTRQTHARRRLSRHHKQVSGTKRLLRQ